METLPVWQVVCLSGEANELPIWRFRAWGAGMRRTATALFAALVGLGACSQGTNNQAQANLEEANQSAENAAEAPESKGNDAVSNASLPEPKGPIDPKSVEAAGQVVQHYGALIEQKRWAESRTLWGNADAAKEFERNWRDYSDVHLEIGNPGDMGGAAGSSYVTIPAIFYGDLKSGQPSRLEADVILRRVNEVPGSTEAQRRWHIERIDSAH
jgi:hypothetical protein